MVFTGSSLIKKRMRGLPGEEEGGLASLPPTEEDLVALCRELNLLGAKHVVVRVSDENQSGPCGECPGIDYAEASKSVITRELGGTSIPFASPELHGA